MKNYYLILSLIAIANLSFATHINRTQGSTIDVFNELTIQPVNSADTLYIKDGFGDVFLQAGVYDDGAPYVWSFGNFSGSTHIVPFSFLQATTTLQNGMRGALVSVYRSNPSQMQFVWVIYSDLPLKPLLPVGESSICAGSNSTYTTLSANSNSYLWSLIPSEAGTLSNDNTASVTILWNKSWSGNASLSVKGEKDGSFSPLSDKLEIFVIGEPEKPFILGNSIANKLTPTVYNAFSANAQSWSWFISEPQLAIVNPNGQKASFDFQETGKASITVQATNECGNSLESDAFEVTIEDIPGLKSQILKLEEDKIVLTDENISLKIEITELNDFVKELDTQVANLEQTNFALQTLIEDLTAENNELLAEIQALYTENDKLLSNIETLTLLNSDLTEQVNDLNSTVNELNQQITSFDKQLDDLSTENSDLKDQIVELNATIDDLNFLIDDILQTTNTLRQTISTLSNENDALKQQVKTMELLIDDLNAQIQVYRQVYVLSWEVTDVSTRIFETAIGNFSISLYPNPSPGEIFISCTEVIKEIKIFNLQGSLIKQMDVNGLETSVIINRSEMAVGVYLFAIKTAKGSSTHRVVFQ
jgi:peptidoglycan hydrolase CwlO-like protein